jgi:cytidylate kinase
MTRDINDLKGDVPVITIDGPSGSGKGTISRKIASILHWNILDSGALYRVIAYSSILMKLNVKKESAIKELISSLDIKFAVTKNGQQKVYLNQQNVSSQIRSESCGKQASYIAKYMSIREELKNLQRNYLRMPGLVADGRDMGTIVFPTSKLKIFLTATDEERASRRYKQLKEKDINVSLPAVLRDINIRDKRDRERENAPLVAADDAHIIDSTKMTIKEVTTRIMHLYEKL